LSVGSPFLISHFQDHLEAVIRILKYIKKFPNEDPIYEDKGNTQIVGYVILTWQAHLAIRCSTTLMYRVVVGINLIL